MVIKKLYLMMGLLLGLVNVITAQQEVSYLVSNVIPTYEAIIISTQYEMIEEEIEIVPALNGDMDTSNYFLMTEIIEIRPAVQEWSMEEGEYVMINIPAEYMEIEKKFFPFKNILDVDRAINVIPAEVITVKRIVVVEDSKIDFFRDGNNEEKLSKRKNALNELKIKVTQ